MKSGRNCLSHAAQLPVLNGRKCSPTCHESSTFPILVINKIFGYTYVSYNILDNEFLKTFPLRKDF